jgi:hypothetical protein
MPTDSELNRNKFFQGELELESAIVNGQHYVRDLDGTWRYVENWIKVPGARDLTLTEHFDPKFVVSSKDVVERVVVDGKQVEENPELLGWCLREGTAIPGENGTIAEVLVPALAWQERNRLPGEIVAPENSDREPERELARAERAYREADRALEIATANRAEVMRRYAEDMTRQEARRITDLSVGRIQQIIRHDTDLDHLDRLVLMTISDRIGGAGKIRQFVKDRFGVDVPLSTVRQRLRSLRSRNLLMVEDSILRLTEEGIAALMNSPADTSLVAEGN